MPLAKYTTFRIGGPADIFAQPRDVKELKCLLKEFRKRRISIFLMGLGSNLLVSDKGVRGAVIRLCKAPFKKITIRGKIMECGSGALLSQVIFRARNADLSGHEFLSGIPGTLGGALAMNAGAWGKSIKDLVESVTIMDYNGKIKVLKKNRLKFSYRRSNLAKYIILSARLKLNKSKKEIIARELAYFLKKRRFLQELSLASAGCIFKNPKKQSAGKLIDSCGLKGKKAGRALISEKHANFIVNTGNAKAKEVLSLISLIKKEIKKKYGIELKPEIKIWF